MAELMTYQEQCAHTLRLAADRLNDAAEALRPYEKRGSQELRALADMMRRAQQERPSTRVLIRVAEALVGVRG